jgi:hypothetical protein
LTESLGYDLDVVDILWRKHLAWLKTIGLRGVGPEDRSKVRDRFDDEFEEDDMNYPVEVIEG